MGDKPGYAGSILRVDLSSGRISTVPTAAYSDRFLGGRGIAAKIHWDEVSPQTYASDPENRIVMTTGPVCGVPGFASSRWQISGKSPLLNQFTYANLGGSWGAQLKFAGYDGLIIQGKADALSYLVIDNTRVELRDASDLKGLGTRGTCERLREKLGKPFRVVAVGQAGENTVSFATLVADADSCGSNGLGAVMGSKNLKAVAVSGDVNVGVADSEEVQRLRKTVRELKPEPWAWPTQLPMERMKRDVCYGCMGCNRVTYSAEDGRVGKYMCQAAGFYEVRAQRYYGEVTEVPFRATKLCDDYGIDTRAMETMIMWLSRCNKSGILTDDHTGIPLSQLGSLEFIETLLHKIAFREGFGETLANGTIKAAQLLGKEAEKLITDYMIKTGEDSPYGPRMHITTGLLYGMEPRMPIAQLHEVGVPLLMWSLRAMGLNELPSWNSRNLLVTRPNYMTSEVLRAIAKRSWGSEIAADFSTYEGKAMCAAKIQDREYAKECLILCDQTWPILDSLATDDHVGDPTLESLICAAVTGMETDEENLNRLGERVFNLQRAILAREGRAGRKHDSPEEFNFTVPLKSEFNNPDCLVPGKDGATFSRKGMVLDRDEFEKMKDEFYEIRGWDVPTGLQTRKKLEGLGLKDVAEWLQRDGLLA